MPSITTQIATSDASTITIRGKDLVNELMRRCTYTEMIDKAYGRHLTINATGAIAALLLEIGVPADIMRAIAVVSRCGGLPGHIMEERRTRSARHIRQLAEEHIPYESPESQT